jgi:hypothetical protein
MFVFRRKKLTILANLFVEFLWFNNRLNIASNKRNKKQLLSSQERIILIIFFFCFSIKTILRTFETLSYGHCGVISRSISVFFAGSSSRCNFVAFEMGQGGD